MSIEPADFAFIRDLVRERSSISLDESKTYLVEARLKPIIREIDGGYCELVAQLRARPRGPLAQRVVEAMTTNETSWMRDAHPFETIQSTIIPAIAEQRVAGPITIWSGACSSGQEPYGLAMTIADRLPHLRSRVRIVATDISEEILDKARAGVYSQLEVNRGMAAPMLMKHFAREGAGWKIHDDIRAMVEFRQHNLAESFAGIPQSDLVLMRNVLIYFELPVKQAILAKVRQIVRPDGYLLLGASETAVGVDAAWSREQHGRTTFYRPETVEQRKAS